MHDAPRLRVSALLTRGSEVLLVRHEKHGRAYWLLPGGGVEAGETLHEALRRELREECGLTALVLGGPIALVESIAPPAAASTRHIVHVVFAAPLPSGSLAHLASGDPDVHTLRLFARGELGDLDLRPPIRRFLERWQPGDPFVHLGSVWAQ